MQLMKTLRFEKLNQSKISVTNVAFALQTNMRIDSTIQLWKYWNLLGSEIFLSLDAASLPIPAKHSRLYSIGTPAAVFSWSIIMALVAAWSFSWEVSKRSEFLRREIWGRASRLAWPYLFPTAIRTLLETCQPAGVLPKQGAGWIWGDSF